MISIGIPLFIGLIIGLLIGLITGSAGTILGLRLLHVLKVRKFGNKKKTEDDFAYKDINFLHSKFKDVG